VWTRRPILKTELSLTFPTRYACSGSDPQFHAENSCIIKQNTQIADSDRSENTTTSILTNTAKQFRLGKLRLSKSSRIGSRYAVVSSLPYAPHAEVVECALSATPNPLESLVGQNEKSPLVAIFVP
jgi:hypothetical protein